MVFDSLARLPPSSQLVAAAAEIPLTIVVSRAAARADTDALEAAGVQVLVATGENEPARVRSALDQLGALGVASVLLEGGPHLAGAFLDAGEIDEMRLFLAPLLLGGSAARDPLEGEGRRAHLRGAARAHVRLRERRRRPADLGPPARVVRRSGGTVFTGLIAEVGSVAALEQDGEGATLRSRSRLAARAAARATRSPSTACA